MAVDVLGGPLSFEAQLDTSQLEGNLQTALENIIADITSLNSALAQTGLGIDKAFSPEQFAAFNKELAETNKMLLSMVDIGLGGGVETSQIAAFRQQVAGATTEFERLQTILNFIQQNLSQLNFKPDQIVQIAPAIASITAQIEGSGNAIQEFNRFLSITGANLQTQFSPKVLNTFNRKLAEANKLITGIVQEAIASGEITSGFERFADIQKQAAGTSTELQKMQLLVQYLVDNLGKVKLPPDVFKPALDSLRELNYIFDAVSKKTITPPSLATFNNVVTVEKQVADSANEASKAVALLNDYLQRIAESSTRGFQTGSIEAFKDMITQATLMLRDLQKQGFSLGFDPAQLAALQQNLEATTDPAKQLQIVFAAVGDQLQRLKSQLSPEQFEAINTTLQKLVSSFSQLSGQQIKIPAGIFNDVISAEDSMAQSTGTVINSMQLLQDELQKIAATSAQSFPTRSIDTFQQAIAQTMAMLRNLQQEQHLEIVFDPTQLTALRQALEATTDPARQLQIIIAAVQDQLTRTTTPITIEQFEALNQELLKLRDTFNAFSGQKIEMPDIGSFNEIVNAQRQMQQGTDATTTSLKSLNDWLGKIAASTTQAFQTGSIQAFDQVVEETMAMFRDLQQQGFNLGFDPSQFAQFQQAIASTTDPLQRLQMVTAALRGELQRLKTQLTPEQYQAVAQSVDKLTDSFGRLGEQELAPMTRLRQIRNEIAQLVLQGVPKESPAIRNLLLEATQLQKVMRNINDALRLTSEEVPGIAALQAAFRGVFGAVQAVSGIMGILNVDQEKATQITARLISITSILNGVEQLFAMLKKNSALNVAIETAMLRTQTKAVQENTRAKVINLGVSQAVQGAAKGTQLATEGATKAQAGFASLLKGNYVLYAVAAAAALYAAYKGLQAILRSLSDETSRHKAEVKALADIEKAAVGNYSRELATLSSLLAVSSTYHKNYEAASKAIDEINKKYPERLSNLRLEALGTEQATQAIEEQRQIIIAYAQQQASIDILAKQFEKLAKVQIQITQVQKEGVSWYKALWNEITTTGAATGKLTGKQLELLKLTGRYQDILEDVNGTMDAQQKTASNLAGAMGEATTQQLALNAAMASSDFSANKAIAAWLNYTNTIYNQIPILQQATWTLQQFAAAPGAQQNDWIAVLNQVQATGENVNKVIDLQMSKIKERSATAVKGSKQEKQAEIDLVNFQLQALDFRVRSKEKEYVDDKNRLTKKARDERNQLLEQKKNLEQTTKGTGKQLPSMWELAAESAEAYLKLLQAIGEETMQIYFDTQKQVALNRAAQALKGAGAPKEQQQQVFLITNVDEAVAAAEKATGKIKNVYEQLALDLATIDKASTKQKLDNQIAVTDKQIALAKEGTRELLELEIKRAEEVAAKELLEAGKNAEAKTRIEAQLAKTKADLQRRYDEESARTRNEELLARVNEQLAIVEKGSMAELALLKRKNQLEIDDEISKIRFRETNEALIQAKINEVRSDALVKWRGIEEKFWDEQLRRQLHTIETTVAEENAHLQQIVESPFSNTFSRQRAQEQQLRNTLGGLEAERRRILLFITRGKGDIQDLEDQLKDVDTKITEARGNLEVLQQKSFAERMAKAAADVQALSQSFGELGESLEGIDDDLANFLKSLAEIARVSSVTISSISNISTAISQINQASKAGGGGFGSMLSPLSAIVSTVFSLAGTIISLFQQSKKRKEEAKKALDEFILTQYIGEQEINELYRQRAREQVKLNKTRLQGIEDERALLKKQADEYKTQIATIQTEIQTQLQKVVVGGKIQWKPLTNATLDELEKMFLRGELTGKALELYQELKKIQDAALDVDRQLVQNAQDFREALTGTTADSITDSIIEGFKAGKRSAADFADTFEDLMREAVFNSLKMKYIEPAMTEFFQQFAAAAESGGELTSAEIEDLRRIYSSLIQTFQTQFQQIQQIAAIPTMPLAQANALRGAISGITEQQAELLAGQFGGLRITALDQLTVARTGLRVLQNIDSNVALNVIRMNTLLLKFDSYETGIRQLHVKI